MKRERLEFFQAPKSRRKLGISPSPRAYYREEDYSEFFPVPEPIMQKTIRTVTPHTSLRSVLRQQTVLEGGGETDIFLRLRAKEDARNFSKS